MPRGSPVTGTQLGSDAMRATPVTGVPRLIEIYTVKNFSEIFPKIVGQLKIQMSRKFVRRYSQKYSRNRTGNSSYYLVGEISSLLGKIDMFHNLSGKRSKKSEKISVFVE